jgi:hypothetical protein
MLIVLFLALTGCAFQSRQSADASSFDGQKMPKVGETKGQIESVWGNPIEAASAAEPALTCLFPTNGSSQLHSMGWQLACTHLVVKFGP